MIALDCFLIPRIASHRVRLAAELAEAERLEAEQANAAATQVQALLRGRSDRKLASELRKEAEAAARKAAEETEAEEAAFREAERLAAEEAAEAAAAAEAERQRAEVERLAAERRAAEEAAAAQSSSAAEAKEKMKSFVPTPAPRLPTPTPPPPTPTPSGPAQVDLNSMSFKALKDLLMSRGVPAEAVQSAPSKFALREVAQKHPACGLEFL